MVRAGDERGENMSEESTFFMVKPDAYEHRHEILDVLREAGLRVVRTEEHDRLPPGRALELCRPHEGEWYYERHFWHVLSGPVLLAEVRGEDAVRLTRLCRGPTDPEVARMSEMRTIRSLWGTDLPANAAHASGSRSEALRELAVMFGRSRSEGAERWMYVKQRVGEKGYVQLLDYMGDDHAVAQAARASYARGEEASRKDPKRVRSMMRRGHTSPFEMAEIKIRARMPIYVARQWIRHRTANVNELSMRFTDAEQDAFEVPALGRIQVQHGTEKQMSAELLPDADRQAVYDLMMYEVGASFEAYEKARNRGVSREIARAVLPVCALTTWVWKIDAHNLLKFLALRLERHAQPEIRAFALAIARVVRDWLPMTWASFVDQRLRSVTLSGAEQRAFQLICQGLSASNTRSSFDSSTAHEAFLRKLSMLRGDVDPLDDYPEVSDLLSEER